jgi:hypothetical protein
LGYFFVDKYADLHYYLLSMEKLSTYNVCKIKSPNPRVHVDVCRWHVDEKDPDCCKDTKFGYECDVAELIRREKGEK